MAWKRVECLTSLSGVLKSGRIAVNLYCEDVLCNDLIQLSPSIAVGIHWCDRHLCEVLDIPSLSSYSTLAWLEVFTLVAALKTCAIS